MSVDPAEFPEASDVAAWYDVSGSMAARGVEDMTSRISKTKKTKPACGGKNRRPSVWYSGRWLAEDRRALTAALRRVKVKNGMRGEMARGDRPGYI
jgi:hypothetical protein